MTRQHLLAGVAALALFAAPEAALAQDAAALEARIALLEAQLNALKAEVTASRTQVVAQQQDIIRLDQQAAAPAAPAAPPTPTDGFRIGNSTVKYGGFVKADYTLSDYSGFDPDVSGQSVGNTNRGIDIGAYPLAKTIIAGLNITY